MERTGRPDYYIRSQGEYEIIGCENIVIYDTILINVNILTMEVLF